MDSEEVGGESEKGEVEVAKRGEEKKKTSSWRERQLPAVALCRCFSQICSLTRVHCSLKNAAVEAQRAIACRRNSTRERTKNGNWRSKSLCRRRRRNFDSYRGRAPRRAPPLRSSPPCWVEQQTTVSSSSPTCARRRRGRAWRERREKKPSFFIDSGEHEKRRNVFSLGAASLFSTTVSLCLSLSLSLSCPPLPLLLLLLLLRSFTVLGARERNHTFEVLLDSIDVTIQVKKKRRRGLHEEKKLFY